MNYSFDISIAKEYGVDEAIMIENFKFWIAKNKANGNNLAEGRTWTYNSISAFCRLFPFWTEKQIRRIIDSLISQNVLLTGRHGKNRWDRTIWYAFKDERKIIDISAFAQMGESNGLERQIDIPQTGNPSIADSKPVCKPIPDKTKDTHPPRYTVETIRELMRGETTPADAADAYAFTVAVYEGKTTQTIPASMYDRYMALYRAALPKYRTIVEAFVEKKYNYTFALTALAEKYAQVNKGMQK